MLFEWRKIRRSSRGLVLFSESSEFFPNSIFINREIPRTKAANVVPLLIHHRHIQLHQIHRSVKDDVARFKLLRWRPNHSAEEYAQKKKQNDIVSLPHRSPFQPSRHFYSCRIGISKVSSLKPFKVPKPLAFPARRPDGYYEMPCRSPTAREAARADPPGRWQISSPPYGASVRESGDSA